MLSLGIDQHARQLTISLRNNDGDVIQARQVSTKPEKVQAFFDKLKRDRVRDGESFIAVVEVCGFNDWLIRMLRNFRCPFCSSCVTVALRPDATTGILALRGPRP